MIGPAICDERLCKYYTGVEQPNGTEVGEHHACEAFPGGIPKEVLSGENKHTEPIERDGGIQYEMAVKPIEWTEDQLAQLEELARQDEEDEQSLGEEADAKAEDAAVEPPDRKAYSAGGGAQTGHAEA